ncbi:MAG: hypothetical protein A2513_09970 [Sulfurimonas sp. RIFOXYD12_FULL_33_39]|uniref:hypothetical protein n=1 Tax=unclassified Sulfurimonas TaxID=2623549 RepID=UPI0008CEB4CC|nr:MULTISPECIES: hypothetical protein [unclassified Sulfurimonas]OHE09639.1 MAG: hypothetical protein A2513_09970 [Sulfurimonas sp. RIFOXYD12_FULL_33_39]OHE13853.1 MAG: hypothetical protein A2530_09785 [Sulfurimonas sp. RIFOXYD2_FULL_34_21]DAB27670.1 MAG TPA: hypothetical protein CFH78_06570 [Sulfurimonas sp. UBA10385]
MQNIKKSSSISFSHLYLYRISVLVLSVLHVAYIFSYEPSFYNDDSLFLSRGILDFSVIDFSPHFPGYPTLIILAKGINFFVEDSKYSLFVLTSLCGSFLPMIIFLYIRELSNEKTAFITFLLIISSPYLINISLSMLSESVGLFFFFLSLYMLEIKRYKLTGFILSVSLFARPSYLVLFLVLILYLRVFKKESFKEVMLFFVLVTALFLLYLLAMDGFLYFYEAKRFLSGHFNVWGVGQNSDSNWFNQIFATPNLPFIFLLFILFRYNKNFLPLYMLFFSYLLWMLIAQNPDNLRHLVPLVFIGYLFLADILQKQKILLLLILGFNLFFVFKYDAKLSPMDQIIVHVKDSDEVIFSNRSVEILRESGFRVFDNYYTNSSDYYMQNTKSCIITATKPQKSDYKVFGGRFVGERDLYLTCR